MPFADTILCLLSSRLVTISLSIWQTIFLIPIITKKMIELKKNKFVSYFVDFKIKLKYFSLKNNNSPVKLHYSNWFFCLLPRFDIS